MSDPVTNVEIEDVLSSIRRLVSADDRPAKEAVEADEASDKLVLTPALRVDNDTSPESEDTAEERAQDAPEAASDETDEATADVWEDISGAEGDAPSQNETDETRTDEDTTKTEARDDTPDEAVDAPEDDPVEPPAAAAGLTAHIAEIEEAVAAREDDWEPDGAGDANAAEPTAAVPWQDHLTEETDSSDDDDPLVAPETEGLDPYVPDDDPADEAAFYAEEIVEDAPDAAAKPGNAFLGEDDLLDDTAETILDEDTLRDLVAEIVRQELQGSLGERITRNVRKLVRREIQRALAAQELD